MSSKVIFNLWASGDLAKRSSILHFFRLYKSGNLSKHFALLSELLTQAMEQDFESIVALSPPLI